MTPEQKAVAEVIRIMKPHHDSREFPVWQDWTHRLARVVHNEPAAVVREWMRLADISE